MFSPVRVEWLLNIEALLYFPGLESAIESWKNIRQRVGRKQFRERIDLGLRWAINGMCKCVHACVQECVRLYVSVCAYVFIYRDEKK